MYHYLGQGNAFGVLERVPGESVGVYWRDKNADRIFPPEMLLAERPRVISTIEVPTLGICAGLSRLAAANRDACSFWLSKWVIGSAISTRYHTYFTSTCPAHVCHDAGLLRYYSRHTPRFAAANKELLVASLRNRAYNRGEGSVAHSLLPPSLPSHFESPPRRTMLPSEEPLEARTKLQRALELSSSRKTSSFVE